MNRLASYIHSSKNKKKLMLLSFTFATVLVAVFMTILFAHFNTLSHNDSLAHQEEQKVISEITEKTKPVVEEPVVPKSNTTQAEVPIDNSATTNKTPTKSQVQKQSPSTSPPQAQQTTPQVNEFGVYYLSISGSSVYCSYYGNGYDVHIYDVSMGLRTNTGGQITVGFEVTGGIQDTWNGYRQPVTIAAGSFNTSLNKAIGRDPNYPQHAFSQTIPAGHGPAAVRAVVYTPNLAYSQWIQVPAQQNGEKCN
jgi:outer membrane biosynthesis protein TonB